MTPADRPLHVAIGCLAAGLALSPFAPRTALLAAAAAGTLVLLAFGALAGLVFLGERLTTVQTLAIAAVMAAAIGTAAGAAE